MNSSLETTITAFGSQRSYDYLLERFDQCWLAGNSPRIEDFLIEVASEDVSHVISEFIEIELEYRLDRMEQVDPLQYHAQFPEHTGAIDLAFKRLNENREGLEPRFRLRDGGQLFGLIIGKEIGRGGVAVVYRVLDADLSRPLALKTLLDERSAVDYRRDAILRLQQEAVLTARLSHPGVPPVHSVGELPDGRPYFCMRLIEGHTFAQILKSNPQDLAGHLRIFAQVAHILAAAHEQQVIHRDLKPSNVMVGKYGEIQLMDWGMGKQLASPPENPFPDAQLPSEISLDTNSFDEESEFLTLVALDTSVDMNQTASGPCEVLGTLAYMPPEQARGQASLHDYRTDVFALGGILCQILTNRPPYFAETPRGLWLQACEGKLDDTRKSIGSAQVDQELKDLALSCLSAEPSSRPANANVVAHAMEVYFNSANNRIEVAKIERAQALIQATAERTRATLEATRRRIAIALCVSLVVVFVITIVFVTADSMHRRNAHEAQQKHERERAASLSSALLLAPPEAVPYAIEALRPLQAYAQAELTSKIADESLPQSQKLHAVLALSQFGHDNSRQIAILSLNAASMECPNIVTALVEKQEKSVESLLAMHAELSQDREVDRSRIAILLLYLGCDTQFCELASLNENSRLTLLQTLRYWHGEKKFLLKYLRESNNSKSRATICQALAASALPDSLDRKEWNDGISQLLVNEQDSYLHSSLVFLASKWQVSSSSIPRTHGTTNQEWYRSPSGLTLIRVLPGLLTRKLPKNEDQLVELTKAFWLSDREVSSELYSQYLKQSNLSDTKLESGFSWNDGIQFCNWLSQKEHLQPCYVLRPKGTEKSWEWDRNANGYRLPTEAEWELAAGDLPKPALLVEFAVFNQAVAADSATKLPNRLGFFDMYGNLQEWCYDGWGNHEAGDYVIDPIGSENALSRVRRGLSYRHSLGAYKNGSRSFGDADDRTEECGLRIARSISNSTENIGSSK